MSPATVRLKNGVSDKQAQAEADVALQRVLELMRPGLANYRERDREEVLTQRALLVRGGPRPEIGAGVLH